MHRQSQRPGLLVSIASTLPAHVWPRIKDKKTANDHIFNPPPYDPQLQDKFIK